MFIFSLLNVPRVLFGQYTFILVYVSFETAIIYLRAKISISPIRDFPSQLQLFFLVGKNSRLCSKAKRKRNERSNELLLLENKIARFHPRRHQSLFQVIQPEKASRWAIGVKALIQVIAASFLFTPSTLRMVNFDTIFIPFDIIASI